MKTKLKILFLLFSISFFNSSFAQTGRVTGVISDGGLPLPGATIVVSGTSKGATTDFDGKFVLSDITTGSIDIQISYIGYSTKTESVEVKEDETTNIGILILESNSEELNEIVLNGGSQRNSEARALSIQKKSLSIKNVIAADGIGKLPDRNAAETVQRIQGLSIERDQGEGRFVSVRGLPPFWSSTTINGNRIPTAEEETTSRATAFDFFPSELIGYVEASKAITPDMDADAIGGSVNFITQTAPSKKILNVNVGGGYNDKSGKGVYNAGVTLGNKTKDGKFGYILNATHWNRNYGTDNFEARRKGDEGVFRMELRDYNGVRKTTGLNGALEYNFNDNNKVTFKSVYGTLVDEEEHYKHRVRFDKFDDSDNTARVELQNIHNKLITELFGMDLGGKHTFKNSVLDWNAATYTNSFKYGDIPDYKNNSYFVVKFKQDGVGINPDYLDVREAGDHRAYWKADGGLLDYDNPDALFGFFSDPSFKMDATQMKFSDLELYKVSITERDNIIAAVNYEYNISDAFKLKFGGKFRDKDRRAKFEDLFYEWTGSASTPYLSDYSQYIQEQPGRADFLSELGGGIQNSFGPVLSTEGMQAFWQQNQANNLELQSYSESLQFNSGLGRNFDVDEQHAAAYAMGTYKFSDKLTVLGGARLSHTTTKITGYAIENGSRVNVTNTNSYTDILPMLHVKYSISNDLNVRLAATKTFARPNFGDLTPAGTFVEVDNTFKGGNPNLNPTYSWNFDLLGEYYFKNVGVINAGVFYKSITDPIYQDSFFGSYNGNQGVQFTAPNNGNNAWIGGIELGINKRFDFLPGVFKYFGTQLNATLMDSEMTIPVDATTERVVTTPYQAKQLYNAQLYFEKGGLNARIAFNHKGKYALEFGDKDVNDLYYGKYNTMDFSASYKFGKHFTIFTDVNNILNQPLIYHYGQTEDRPAQVEYYGLRGSLGVKFNL
ncbi:TonB-dependent receptor [Pseudofulvibacter geojedonensis]|uniref:TonB-dependent receptor n=1 Tax=Pseudofulvibacter geojedonensis TaxID=1123758 RepID=A0ABW3I0E9_9FLAO